MSSISGSVYLPCCHIDPVARTAAHGKYNYTETLEKTASAQPDKEPTYWVPDECGRVYIDPKHPRMATLEHEDASSIQLPSPGSAVLPAVQGSNRADRREAERKDQEEKLRMFREERARTARQEALLHRLTQSILASKVV